MEIGPLKWTADTGVRYEEGNKWERETKAKSRFKSTNRG